MVCTGRDSRLDWMSIAQLAFDRLLAFQLVILAVALDRIALKVDILGLP